MRREYSTFEQLFNDAITFNAIETPKSDFEKKIAFSIHDVGFTQFLQQHKNLKYGDTEHYDRLLTKDMFLEYLTYQKNKEFEKKTEYVIEKKSWQISNDNNQKYKMDNINERLIYLNTNKEKYEYLLNLKLEFIKTHGIYNEHFDKIFGYWKKTIPEQIDTLINLYKEISKLERKTETNEKEANFKDLFKDEYHDKIDSFKGWLRNNEFINENNQLLDLPTNFARIYYLLKYQGIIKPNIKDSVGIKTYFSDFQCEVKEKINPDSKNKEITRKTVTNQNAKSDLIYYPDNSPINNEDIIKLFS